MKCPKCGYLGFETVERCRNCGYEFSLSPPATVPDLSIRSGDDDDPAESFDDLSLIDAAAPSARPHQSRELGTGLDEEVSRAGSSRQSGDLPLFVGSAQDDAPLITRASPPRQPLAVRRSTPEVPRLRTQSRMPMLELSPEEEADSVMSPAARAHSQEWPPERPPRVELEPAGLGARGIAVAIDLFILAAIDVVVVYFTMRICGLTFDDIYILPKGPLLGFLIVQNGGYLVAFTAGGQTLGKMAAGVRVVPLRSDGSLEFGQSVIRTLVWVALAVPAGLGFLTTLGDHDRRGLHDRFARTRVVRASA